MTWSSEEITKFEGLISQLSAEAHRAKPGSDEGLIPIYSLVGDIADSFKQDDALNQAVTSALATLQALLDTAANFDDESIGSMVTFAKWCEQALSQMSNGTEIEAYSGKAPSSTSQSLTDVEEDASFTFAVPEPDDALTSIEIVDDIEAIEEIPTTIEFDDTPAVPETVAFSEEIPPLWSFDEITQFEKISQQFSTETLLAEKDTDNGMLPVYSLLKDFQTAFANKDTLQNGIEIVLKKMDSLLDEFKPYDDPAITLLTEFNLWMETARAEIQIGRDPIPFEPSEVAYSEVEAVEIDLGDDDSEDHALLKEFSEFDVIMDLNMTENRELLEEFYSEAIDHLGQIESAVLELEQDVGSRDAINSMFRSFHTIKGVAGFLNLIPVNRLAHEVESLMDLVRNDEIAVFTGIIDLVLESKDKIGQLMEQISTALVQGTEPKSAIEVSQLMARARWAMKGPEEYAKITGDSRAAHIEGAAPTEETPAADPEDAETPSSESSASINAPAIADAPAQKAKTKVNENASIRVNTWKLDNLMDMVGELVIVQSQLLESSKGDVQGDTNFQSNMSQLTRITKDLQHTSMALRMIPIKATFQKMGRIVRDIGAKAGKKANFRVVGEDTELDRNVVEEIGDPLVHMVRNALDHGLEPPEDRIAVGKPEYGDISLKAYHQGSNIVIELKDDGRGIDPARILQKAIANGIVREDEQLPDEEIFKLIFAPGFSTAEQITDISGRGVGMDVVKKNIEKLRGKVSIESVLGKGSTFKILLPLTMAIVDGLVVKVGADRFILPTTSVKVALRPDSDVIGKIQGNEEILNIRGKVIPLFRLHNHFQIPDAITETKDCTVVIVETGGKPCGLMVDDMVSKQEVVIKSLGGMMQGIPGVSGGAILGDGTIALILDPATLISGAA